MSNTSRIQWQRCPKIQYWKCLYFDDI